MPAKKAPTEAGAEFTHATPNLETKRKKPDGHYSLAPIRGENAPLHAVAPAFAWPRSAACLGPNIAASPRFGRVAAIFGDKLRIARGGRGLARSGSPPWLNSLRTIPTDVSPAVETPARSKSPTYDPVGIAVLGFGVGAGGGCRVHLLSPSPTKLAARAPGSKSDNTRTLESSA